MMPKRRYYFGRKSLNVFVPLILVVSAFWSRTIGPKGRIWCKIILMQFVIIITMIITPHAKAVSGSGGRSELVPPINLWRLHSAVRALFCIRLAFQEN